MAVRFSEAGDRLSYAASNPPHSSAVTVTAWVYNVGGVGSGTMCRLYAGGTIATFCASAGGLNGPLCATTGGSVGPYAPGSDALPIGAWRRVAYTIGSGGACTIYWGDADPETSAASMSGSVATGQPTGIAVGGRSPSDAIEWWDGRIAHMRVWSAVLTEAQVEAEWASAAPVVTSGLWADWPLATHTDLTDHSGNGRHLVAGSTAVTTEDGPPLGSPSVAVDQAVEVDTAGGIVPAVLTGQAAEMDTAAVFTSAVVVEPAAELDTADAVTPTQLVLVDQATEVDTAGAVVPLEVITLGQAVEQDTAQAVTPTQLVLVAQAVELDTAMAVDPPTLVLIGQAVETDTAWLVTPAAVLTGWPPRVSGPHPAPLLAVAGPTPAPLLTVTGPRREE